MRDRCRVVRAMWVLALTALAAMMTPSAARADSIATAARRSSADGSADTLPSAQDIVSMDTSEFPVVSVTAVTDAPVEDLETFTVTQDGAPRPVMWVTEADGPLQLALVIDTSRHMRDDLRPAAAAAAEFLLRLPADTEASLISAAGDAGAVVDRTPDIGALITALADLRAGGEPALLEAVSVAVDQFPPDAAGRRAVVVVTGAGDGDAAQVRGVARMLRERGVSLFGITQGDDRLEEVARTAGGSIRRVDAITQPLPALRHVDDDLTNLYRIDFTAYGGDTPTEIGVAVGPQAEPRPSVTVTLPEPDGDGTAVSRSAVDDPTRTTIWTIVATVAVIAAVASTARLVRRRQAAAAVRPFEPEART